MSNYEMTFHHVGALLDPLILSFVLFTLSLRPFQSCAQPPLLSQVLFPMEGHPQAFLCPAGWGSIVAHAVAAVMHA